MCQYACAYDFKSCCVLVCYSCCVAIITLLLNLVVGTLQGALASQEDTTQNAAVVYETTLNIAIIATMDPFVTIKRVKSLLIGRAKKLIMKKCVVLMPLYNCKVILMIHRLAVSFVMTLILHHRMI